MHKKFDSTAIEKKWQEQWKQSGIYTVGARDHSKEKEYVLVEWPYPSGNLHIGHWYAFAVPDIYVRYRRMTGKQVLYPMGFDAFGLPAENAAIKRGLDPRQWTQENMSHMRTQLESMGNAFSWDKTTSSIDESYYAVTQWMFTEFFKKGIAYRGHGTVNWCSSCNTVIANEQVTADNTCERCGTTIEKKLMPQWMLKTTAYADRLIDDLDTLDWPEHIKEAQRQWIGRSKGARITFSLSTGDTATVFTTRPDTLYGATYLVLAPEHPLIAKNATAITNYSEVAAYVTLASQKDEQDRLDATKEKTGVCLAGITATNPATKEAIPLYVADYVIGSYGTGAIMAVPAHDERDFAFARKYQLPMKQVVIPLTMSEENLPKAGLPEVRRKTVIVHVRNKATGQYVLLRWHGTLEGTVTAIMGGIEDGQDVETAALAEIHEELALPNARIVSCGRWITAAKYCASHKGVNRWAEAYAVLAEVDDVSEQGTIAEAELATHTPLWVDQSEVRSSLTPQHQKEVWDMLHTDGPQLSWGYLTASGEFDDRDAREAQEQITAHVGGEMTATYRLRDWSIGRQRYWGVPIPIVYDPTGTAHVVPKEHLPWTLPSDVDFTPTGVPPLEKSIELKERTEKIFGAGWTPEVETMDTFVDSSWYFLRYLDSTNTDVPASLSTQKDWMQVDMYFGGAEHTTMHLLYSRFWHKALFDLGLVLHEEPYLRRVNRGLILGPDGNKMSKSKGNVIDPDAQVQLVGADTVKMYLAFMGPYEGANYPFDLGGIAGIRRFLERVYGLTEHVCGTAPHTQILLHKTIKKVHSDIQSHKFNTAISAMMILLNEAEKSGIERGDYELFVRLLTPFAPHLCEEIWSELGHTTSVHTTTYPEANETLFINEAVVVGVQINGKMRGTITLQKTTPESEAVALAHTNPEIARYISTSPNKVVYVPGRILNLIVPTKDTQA